MNPIDTIKQGIIDQDWSKIHTAYELLTGIKVNSFTQTSKAKSITSNKPQAKRGRKPKIEKSIHKSGIEETVGEDGTVFVTDHSEPPNPDFVKVNNKQYRPEIKKIPCSNCGKMIYRSDAAKFNIGTSDGDIICVQCLKK